MYKNLIGKVLTGRLQPVVSLRSAIESTGFDNTLTLRFSMLPAKN